MLVKKGLGMEKEGLKITFLMDYFKFTAGQEIFFNKNDITVLFGDQGAGKTTLIKSFSSKESLKKYNNKYILVDNFPFKNCLYAESESFRRRDGGFILSRLDTEKIILNDMSHGQAWRRFIDTIKKREYQDSLVIFDEPETSLSVESTLEFCRLINYLKKELRLTVIIATHNPVIIEFLADRIIEVPSCEDVDKTTLLSSIKEKVDLFRCEFVKN